VLDVAANAERLIGKLSVPPTWETLEPGSNWFVEYTTEVQDCESLPYTKATFGPSLLNGTLPRSEPILKIDDTSACASTVVLGSLAPEKVGYAWVETGRRGKPN